MKWINKTDKYNSVWYASVYSYDSIQSIACIGTCTLYTYLICYFLFCVRVRVLIDGNCLLKMNKKKIHSSKVFSRTFFSRFKNQIKSNQKQEKKMFRNKYIDWLQNEIDTLNWIEWNWIQRQLCLSINFSKYKSETIENQEQKWRIEIVDAHFYENFFPVIIMFGFCVQIES